MLADAASWLHNQRHDHLSSPVTYYRAAENTQGSPSGTTLQATVGRTAADQLAVDQWISSAGVRDYLVRSQDFTTASVLVPPASRDWIRDADGTEWEVAEIGGEPCWRFSDEYKNALRVHTIRR